MAGAARRAEAEHVEGFAAGHDARFEERCRVWRNQKIARGLVANRDAG
jgi:hypothetical protein